MRKLTATLRSNLEKCATDPNIDPVHDLRTGTRRLQAMIEAILRERSDDALLEPAEEWLEALKKMRRAAAPVRDLDVHRKLLQKLVKYGHEDGTAGSLAPDGASGIVTSAAPDIVESPAAALSTNPA